MAIQVRIERAGMEQRDVSVPQKLDVVSEQVDSPINERSLRLGPGWDLDPSYLAWVSNYRDWNDVLRDCTELVNKPLNLLKRLVG